MTVHFHLDARTGVRAGRWPLALVAPIAGWIPATGSRNGLVDISTGLAFLAVMWAARQWSRSARTPMRWSPVAVVTGVALAAASLSYGALHPLLARDLGPPEAPITLRDGRSAKLSLLLENTSPLTTRIRGIELVGTERLRVARLQTDSHRTEAPTLEGLYRPLGNQTVHAAMTSSST